jgi:hypothetical protein
MVGDTRFSVKKLITKNINYDTFHRKGWRKKSLRNLPQLKGQYQFSMETGQAAA